MARKKKIANNRLARNFHNTFVPERQYINAMLGFAARGGSGDTQEIAAETGIPTGKSSGKVAPTLDYCRGMGLILLPKARSSVKTPELTPFGRVVYLDDRFLKEPLTQWIAHLHLCDIRMGAEVWYQVFWNGSARLGMQFSRGTLEEWLSSACDTPKGGLVGPLVRMYEEEASFKTCGALTENGEIISQQVAPLKETFAWGYGTWLVSLMESIAKIGSQVTLTDLEEKGGWRTTTGWNLMEAQSVLEMVERKGILTVDRHMNPWILRATDTATNLWQKIYSDLI